MNTIQFFEKLPFIDAVKQLFKELQVPVNYIDDKPARPADVLGGAYKPANDAHALIGDVYVVGMIDENAFKNIATLYENKPDIKNLTKDYEGLLLFGIELKQDAALANKTKLLPTRTQLADITRAFNKVFPYTPCTLVFRYDNYIALANVERIPYKQEWREGEKQGKVSILKDVCIDKTHAGHLRILHDLTKPKDANGYAGYYKHWLNVLNVAVLNKKFFQELANWYFWAIKMVVFPADMEKDADVRNATGVIRLLTRIIFVWFLKEKGLVNSNLFDEQKLKTLLRFTDKQHSTYYKAILQNLFFATLNTEMGTRKFRAAADKSQSGHYFIHNLFRYEKEFVAPYETLEQLFAPIPFLNGGLFECLDKQIDEDGKEKEKKMRIDGFSDREDNVLQVPDELFFTAQESEIDLNETFGTKNKKYKVRGLINILDSYKFTITENTPLEEEIALDPELLGKVFENLLASYNPETQTTARKQTGSFYTPREIVNYMVDESLIAYLKTKMSSEDVPHLEGVAHLNPDELETKLRTLIAYDNDRQPFNEQDKTQLIYAIDNIKILDPACGSGAFPMGVLHKLVHVLHKIDPKNILWKQRQIDKAEQIDDANARDAAVKMIEDAFTDNELDYSRKLFLIENCIYGVDIQPIAVQISKLRFFISLIVDQKIHPKKDNLGIRPLPNLETKFVAANTLIGLEKESTTLFTNPQIEKKKAELKKVRHDYFEARTPKRKENCRTKDKQLREELTQLLITNHELQPETAKILASWNPYNQNASASFFDMEWMFGMKDGFDVVIGNPPYIQMQKDGGELANIYAKQNYKTYERTGDIYCLFYEYGNKVLVPKGILTYITSNKWMRAGYGESMRKYFIEHTNPLILIDFGGVQIFESATVDTNIIVTQKDKYKRQIQACVVNKKDDSLSNLSDYFNQHKSISANFATSNSWVVLSSLEENIKAKIEKIGTPLKDWDIQINYGIKTGFNEAFIISKEIRDKLVNEDPKSDEIIRPILRGRDIEKYKANWAGLYLIATFPSMKYDIEKYPAVKEHLLSFGYDRIKQTGDKGARKKTNNKWFETQDSIGYWDDFFKQKIVWKAVGRNLAFSLLEEGIYLTAPASFITSENNLYLLAFLCSSYGKWYIYNNSDKTGAGDIMLNIQSLLKMPIPKITKENQSNFDSIVNQIIEFKTNNTPIVELEKVIDKRIFELFKFTDEEIKLIINC